MKIFKVTQQGFTLLELMITVAIIGLIASIAIPSYTDYVKQGRAAEATAVLANLRIQMEQCYQDNRDYTQCAAFCTPTSGDVNFTYSCTPAATADTYTLNAAGKGSVSNFSYTVDESNDKTSTYDGVSGNCWKTSKTSSC